MFCNLLWQLQWTLDSADVFISYFVFHVYSQMYFLKWIFMQQEMVRGLFGLWMPLFHIFYFIFGHRYHLKWICMHQKMVGGLFGCLFLITYFIHIYSQRYFLKSIFLQHNMVGGLFGCLLLLVGTCSAWHDSYHGEYLHLPIFLKLHVSHVSFLWRPRPRMAGLSGQFQGRVAPSQVPESKILLRTIP